MRVDQFFLLSVLAATGVSALSGQVEESVLGQGAADQRRVELRSVLKSQNASGEPRGNSVPDRAALPLRLSEQQRAQLRLQLRQNRREPTSP